MCLSLCRHFWGSCMEFCRFCYSVCCLHLPQPPQKISKNKQLDLQPCWNTMTLLLARNWWFRCPLKKKTNELGSSSKYAVKRKTCREPSNQVVIGESLAFRFHVLIFGRYVDASPLVAAVAPPSSLDYQFLAEPGSALFSIVPKGERIEHD